MSRYFANANAAGIPKRGKKREAHEAKAYDIRSKGRTTRALNSGRAMSLSDRPSNYKSFYSNAKRKKLKKAEKKNAAAA